MSAAELIPAQASELAIAPTEELKSRLTSLLARTAEDLSSMAAIVGELERRGEDLSTLKLGIVHYLRRIAAGQLLPEIVVQYSGYPLMLRQATVLPIEDQRRLISGEPLPVAVWRGNNIEWRRVDPLALTRDHVTQIFAGDHLRTDAEQVSYLEGTRLHPRKPKQPSMGRAKADPKRNGIVIGRSFAPYEDVLLALAQLADADYSASSEEDEEIESQIINVPLTLAEHTQIKVRAAKSRTTIGSLMRHALAAYGLIRKDATPIETT